VLALLGVLAFLGMAVMPALVIGDSSLLAGWHSLKTGNRTEGYVSLALGTVSLGLSVASLFASGGTASALSAVGIVFGV
jgi:hypothetical protein